MALNKLNGEVIWKSAVPGCGGCGHASIVIAEVGGIRQYVTLVGSKQLGMIGVHAANGKFLWNYKGVMAVEGHGCIPTPVVQGDLVFISGAYQGGASLVRLVPDGAGGIQAHEVFHLKGHELQVMHGGMVWVDGHIYGGHMDSYIYSPDKFTAVIGLDNVIVINHDNALLICNRDKAQDVKNIIDYLKLNKLNDHL